MGDLLWRLVATKQKSSTDFLFFTLHYLSTLEPVQFSPRQFLVSFSKIQGENTFDIILLLEVRSCLLSIRIVDSAQTIVFTVALLTIYFSSSGINSCQHPIAVLFTSPRKRVPSCVMAFALDWVGNTFLYLQFNTICH